MAACQNEVFVVVVVAAAALAIQWVEIPFASANPYYYFDQSLRSRRTIASSSSNSLLRQNLIGYLTVNLS